MSPFKFGHFDAICERAALTICPLIGTDLGVMPTCYARNVQLGSQIIFQPGKSSLPLICFSKSLTRSNMLRSHRRFGDDRNHAVPREIEVHRCRTKGNRVVFLHLHVR